MNTGGNRERNTNDDEDGPSNPPPPPGAEHFTNVYQRALNDDTVSKIIDAANLRAGALPVAENYMLQEVAFNPSLILSTRATPVNGDKVMQPQTVSVEYLRRSQLMLVPAMLACNTLGVDGGYGVYNATLISRIRKLSVMPYGGITQLVTQHPDYQSIRAAVDGLPNVEEMPMVKSWDSEGFANDTVDTPRGYVDSLFAHLSTAIQLNCDLRDVGFLVTEMGHVRDDEHMDVSRVPLNRIENHVCPFTIASIACLNYDAVGRNWWAASTRAYGIGVGILPAPGSASKREYTFTMQHPTKEYLTAWMGHLDTAHLKDSRIAVCMNLIAMFGLFHLNKDHTFRTGDSAMARIGKSYLNTIRTMVPAETMNQMHTDQELFVRTTQHPFGLAQSYFPAKAMHKFGILATPLALRITTTPPPVQRVMIARAAYTEWNSIPCGQAVSSLYGRSVNVISEEAEVIEQSPAQYSALYRLYGYAVQKTISENARLATETLMPVVYGFAMSQHSDDGEDRDGLALALSLSNVLASKKTLAESFRSMWTKYIETAEKDGN